MRRMASRVTFDPFRLTRFELARLCRGSHDSDRQGLYHAMLVAQLAQKTRSFPAFLQAYLPFLEADALSKQQLSTLRAMVRLARSPRGRYVEKMNRWASTTVPSLAQVNLGPIYGP
jgi:hypothetical protein